MEHAIMERARPWLPACFTVLLTGLWLLSPGSAADPVDSDTGARAEEVPRPAEAWQPIDPARVAGHGLCVDCHKSEVVSWLQTAHATRAFDMLRISEKAAEFSEKLGIAAGDVAVKSVCIRCHATPIKAEDNRIGILSGVSCEACHNGAGGEDGWLNRHASYGPPGTRRSEETADHRQARVAYGRAAGQHGVDDVYGLARRCYECHVIGLEELVITAGHPVGDPGFELVSWLEGEVRHNFHLDQRVNAEAPTLWMDSLWHEARTPIERRRLLFLVGQLVDLEVSLRARGAARVSGSAVASGAATRVLAVSGRLQQLQGAEELGIAPLLEDLAKATAALFLQPTADQQAEFDALADKVGRVARKIAREHDGSRLGAVDPLLPDQRVERAGKVIEFK